VRRDSDKRGEFAFFFVSDYWKMQRIFEQTSIFDSLVTNPGLVRTRIAEQEWDFAPKDEEATTRDLTIMLWSAKAQVLARN